MVRHLGIVLTISLTATVFVQAQDAYSRDVHELRKFKLVDLPRAYRRQDTTALRLMLGERYERIGFEGDRTTKEEEILRAGHARPTYDTLWFEIHRLDVFQNGSAIVSGTGRVKGRDAQGPYDMSYLSSNTFVKTAGRWLLVNSHVSGRKLVRPL